jgi:hypothetical protein
VRVNTKSNYEVRRSSNGFALCCDEQLLCQVEFAPEHSWASFRTHDGSTYAESGNWAVGRHAGGQSDTWLRIFSYQIKLQVLRIWTFSPKTQALGQLPGRILPQIRTVDRMR